MINASADWNLWQREIASTQQVSLGVSDLSPPWHDYHVHPIGKVSINPLLDSSQNWIPPPWRPGDPGWIFPFWGGHLSLSTEQGENGPMRITHQWKWKSLSCVQLFATPWTIQSMELSRPEYCLSFLQGIFPTQGSNPGLLHCRWILYQLSQKGSPRILEWVAYPFSSGSYWPIELGSPALQANSLPTELPGKPTIYYGSNPYTPQQMISFRRCLCLCHTHTHTHTHTQINITQP